MEAGDTAPIHRLRSVIAQLGLEIPRDDTDLFASGLIDSLTLIELLLEVEQEFGVRVELESFDLEQARTLESLATWVQSRFARA